MTRPRYRSQGPDVAIELEIECDSERTAAALNDVLMPDNRYFPKDQRFKAERKDALVSYAVLSPRLRPAITTVESILSDSKLFSEIWTETAASHSGPMQRLSSHEE